MTMPDGSFGTPYSVSEARGAAKTHKMDRYHRDLILWLCERVEILEDKLEGAEDKIESAHTRRLARVQPCGCIICTCDDPQQCRGCGAKSCGRHPAGEIPCPHYEPHPALVRLEEAEAEIESLKASLAKAQAAKPQAAPGPYPAGSTPWDDTVTDVDLKCSALEMWANHIETGEVAISAKDAFNMKKKHRELSEEQRQLAERLRKLAAKERNSEF